MRAEDEGQLAGFGLTCCGPETIASEAGTTTDQCPMAALCQGMASKQGLGPLMLIPGLVLLIGGVLVLIVPAVLVSLLAGTSIVLGLVLLWLARAIRRLLV